MKSLVSFVILLVTVVSCVTTDYAQAKNVAAVAANFSQQRQTVSSCDRGAEVSELVFRGNCGPNFEDCRPAPSSLPPAFAPPQIAPQSISPPVPAAVLSVADDGVVSLFGLVALAIGGGIGTYLGHNKANEDDKKDAEYWASIDDAASSKTKTGG